MSTLFISDLHLDDKRPDAIDWLTRLVEGPAREADGVYILGDLFEYWIGDDFLSPVARRTAELLGGLTASGTPCRFVHGNRDFLLGEDYAGQCGMQLLPETSVVDLYGTAVLLLHGDTLCTDDVEYQAFRRQARDPAWQAQILAISPMERLELARKARDASMRHMAAVDDEIMDVNEEAVAEAFREHGVSHMIHGHTHRPAEHRYDTADGPLTRTVLADWYQMGSYLEVSPEGMRSHTL